jgi:hypothetical protein
LNRQKVICNDNELVFKKVDPIKHIDPKERPNNYVWNEFEKERKALDLKLRNVDILEKGKFD